MDRQEKEIKLSLAITADGRYKFDRNRIRKAVRDLLVEHGVKGRVGLSLAVVGDRKMKALRKKYLKLEGTTDVLSFSQMENAEAGPMELSDEMMLGDVIVSYPQAKKQALEFYKLLDEEIEFLVCHGVLHLLGIHHD